MAADEKANEKIINEIMGSKVELNLESGLYKGTYSSSLEKVDKDQESSGFPLLGLFHPLLRGKPLSLYRGLEVVLRFETANCIYQSKAETVWSVTNGMIPLLWVRLLTPLQRVQRRRFVRVPCKLKAQAYLLELNVLNNEDEEQDGNKTASKVTEETAKRGWFPLTLNDISLGGVGSVVPRREASMCYLGSRYLLQMTLEKNTYLLATHLVKILPKDEGGGSSVGFSYEGLPVHLEKTMGAFIRQQELSRKQK